MNLFSDFFLHKFRHNYLFNKYLKEVQSIYDLELSCLSEILDRKLVSILEHSKQQSLFYKDLYNKFATEIEDIQSVRDIHKLPIIDKSLIRDHIDKILIGPKLSVRRTETTGTTGSPLKIYRDYNSILLENAYLWYYRVRHGLKLGDPVLSLRVNVDQDIIKYYNKSSNTLHLSSYRIFEENIDIYIDAIKKFKPKAILTYPSSLHVLATEFEKRGVSFNVPITFTSSETLYDYQREKIENIFNTKIFDWYGNAERSIALEQCKYGYYHEAPLYSINEFNKDHIITTSLISKRFPLIRYRVDDIVSIDTKTNCACGFGTPIIRKIVGRSDDYVLLNDGTLLPSIDIALKGVDNILYSQMVQDDHDRVNVNLVINPLFNEDDRQLLLTNLQKLTDNRINFDLNYIGEHEIIRSESGKFKFIINNIIKNKNPL